MWDDRFEKILRTYLPFLSPEQPIEKNSDLRDLGLDSLSMVGLMAALENTYNVRFVNDMMRVETFATPDVLWSGLCELTRSTAG
ncbi:phosphopantetheine-binding protein [Streptomyces sp. NBC_00669]|uniref:phosphopantetheine-binding protein n=1 Tax=unclassified Streptomyces TaxID=2593676 RepID=UPI002E21699A|nr:MULTISPECIES: phosphopantetheine-binding protein [unclassified Streptomyces]